MIEIRPLQTPSIQGRINHMRNMSLLFTSLSAHVERQKGFISYFLLRDK